MLGKITLSLLAVTSLVACGGPSTDEQAASLHKGHDHGPSIQADLAKLREATARYHDINAAFADGFELGINGGVKGCISHATLGAMGYHYGNQARFNDPTINELEPEVLVYHTPNEHVPDANAPDGGSLRLGAVEWVVPRLAWEAATNSVAPPMVYGKALTILNPVLDYYVAHAWIWTPNPADTISNWNPNVTCP